METVYPVATIELNAQHLVLKTLGILLRVAHWIDKTKAVLVFAILVALFVIAVL